MRPATRAFSRAERRALLDGPMAWHALMERQRRRREALAGLVVVLQWAALVAAFLAPAIPCLFR